MAGLTLLLVFYLSLIELWASSRAQGVDSWIFREGYIATAGLFDNIGGTGAGIGGRARGVKPGLVITSPTTYNPDYFFYTPRHGSFVFKYIIDQVASGRDTESTHVTLIEQYISTQAEFQNLETLAGSVSSGENLGEARFEVDGKPTADYIGRPQRDGPALRITTLANYAKYLIGRQNASYVSSTIWPIIQRDAEYVHNTWSKDTYDLWGEMYGFSFFTSAVQHRALRDAAALASAIGQDASLVKKWTDSAQQILCFLQQFYSAPSSYIFANTGGARSSHDLTTILGTIHTYDADAGCDALTFQPCSDKALVNLMGYVDSFRGGLYFYPINNAKDANRSIGIAVGRYMEDIYFLRHPWYVAGFAVAEQLHLALKTWSKLGSITVTDISLQFFKVFVASVAPGTYNADSDTYKTLTSAVFSYAESFITTIMEYTPPNGALSEQYSRMNGIQVSGLDYSWSYAALLTLADARSGFSSGDEGKLGHVWGAKGLALAETCEYKNSGVTVTFSINATVGTGEAIYIAGSTAALSYWHPLSAVKLSTSEGSNVWTIAISGLPAKTKIEYKYRRQLPVLDLNVGAWTGGDSYSITTPESGAAEIKDVWRD